MKKCAHASHFLEAAGLSGAAMAAACALTVARMMVGTSADQRRIVLEASCKDERHSTQARTVFEPRLETEIGSMFHLLRSAHRGPKDRRGRPIDDVAK